MGSSNSLTKRKKAHGRRRKKQVFITAPLATDTTLIRRLLTAEGVDSFAADELTATGECWQDIVEDAIERADMVIVVLPRRVARENVLIELGLALACKKPILIIADDKAHVPGLAATIPYLRTDLNNEEALRFGLAQFLRAPKLKNGAARQIPKQTRPIGSRADEFLAKLRSLSERKADAGLGLEKLVAAAIRMSGVATLSERKTVRDSEIDIAVWSDDLEPWVANPLLIEVKDVVQRKDDLDAIASRFRNAYGPNQSNWGLLIYRKAVPDLNVDRAANLGPTVLSISAKDFFDSLRETGFSDLVIRLRNDRMHGRG